jgi:hypothetical protein
MMGLLDSDVKIAILRMWTKSNNVKSKVKV